MFKRAVFYIAGACGVHFKVNRALFIWLGIFFVIGCCVGLSVAFNVRVKVEHISQSLLDTNLVRVIRPTCSLMAMVAGRVFFFALMCGFVFLLCMNKWTVFGVFAVALYQGFHVMVNLYWVIARFGFATGSLLLVSYFFVLIIYSAIMITAIVFLLRATAGVRTGGIRGAIKWREFFNQAAVFGVVVFVFSLVEYILFLVFISKIVYIV